MVDLSAVKLAEYALTARRLHQKGRQLATLVWKGAPYVTLLGAAAYTSVFHVDANFNAVVTRGGEIIRTVGPGYHVKVPFVEEAQPLQVSSTLISIGTDDDKPSLFRPGKGEPETEKAREGRHAGVSAITKDPQEVFVAVNAEVDLPEGDGLSYVVSRIPDYKTLLKNYLLHVTKAVIGTYTVSDLPSKRDEISQKIHQGLTNYIAKGGHDVIKVKTVQVINLDVNDDYARSLAEAAAQGPKLEKAKMEFAIAKVFADTEAARADGIARALQIKGRALQRFPQTLELTRLEKWNGMSPSTVVSGGPATPTSLLLPSSRAEIGPRP